MRTQCQFTVKRFRISQPQRAPSQHDSVTVWHLGHSRCARTKIGASVVPQYLQRGGSTLAGLSSVALSDCISVPPKCAVDPFDNHGVSHRKSHHHSKNYDEVYYYPEASYANLNANDPQVSWTGSSAGSAGSRNITSQIMIPNPSANNPSIHSNSTATQWDANASSPSSGHQ